MEGEEELMHAPKQIKGKDLPGAINVLPAGLGAVLAKRQSKEVTVEQKGSSMTFSSGGHEQTFQQESHQHQQASAASFKSSTTAFGSSQMQQQQQSFMQQQSSASSFSSSFSSSQSSQNTTQMKSILKQPQQPGILKPHGEEIGQEKLKAQIQSAITEIETNMDKENVAPTQQQLLFQQQQQQQQHEEQLRKQQEEQLRFQQEQLQMEQLRLQQQQQEEQLRLQQQEQELLQQQQLAEERRLQEQQLLMEQQQMQMQQQQMQMQQQAMEQTEIRSTQQTNGHFKATDLLRAHDVDGQRPRMLTPHEFKARPQSVNMEDLYTPQELDLPDPATGKKVEYQQTVHHHDHMEESHMNGTSTEETSMARQKMLESTMLGEGNISLSKVMTPVQDYDSNSLKRRNPRQMFTDSAFYSPKFHPSVAEQVEMAHRLSSSLFTDDNKTSKGQDMFLKRAKKSGEEMAAELDNLSHDKVPNLKLVMNPEGKIHDWNDMPEEEVPDMDQVAMVGNPEIARTLVEGMNNCMGRGKVYQANQAKPCNPGSVVVHQSKTSPSFAGSFRQVFDSRRGMFEKNVAIRDRIYLEPLCTFPAPTPTAPAPLVRSKTLPEIPNQANQANLDEMVNPTGLKRPANLLQPSPVVPKRSSSKQMVQMLNDDTRRPLRSFFSNA